MDLLERLNTDSKFEQNIKARIQVSEPRECPICGVFNICGPDTDVIEELSGEQFDARGRIIEFDGNQYAHGTGCWDSAFGDECGGCLHTVVNTETALVGPMGMGH